MSTYSATATLITPPTQAIDTTPVSLATVALYATTGKIPQRAARELDYRGEPQLLASMVSVTPNAETGTLTVSATDTDDQAVADLVNAFARSTVVLLPRPAVRARPGARAELQDAVAYTTKQLQEAKSQLGSGNDEVAQAKISSPSGRCYATQFTELTELNVGGATDLLTVLQPGVPIPAGDGDLRAAVQPLDPRWHRGAARAAARRGPRPRRRAAGLPDADPRAGRGHHRAAGAGRDPAHGQAPAHWCGERRAARQHDGRGVPRPPQLGAPAEPLAQRVVEPSRPRAGRSWSWSPARCRGPASPPPSPTWRP